MIEVTKKDPKESSENLIRRFNRKVQQSGVLAEAKMKTHFEKPLSKPERRKAALIRNNRKEAKLKRIKLGARR